MICKKQKKKGRDGRITRGGNKTQHKTKQTTKPTYSMLQGGFSNPHQRSLDPFEIP